MIVQLCEFRLSRHDKMATGPANSTKGELLRAVSDNRALYLQQSAMTRDGRVPTAQEVREAMRDEDAAP